MLFGDVVRSRRDSLTSTAWLRALRTDLMSAYGSTERLAAFEFTQGDELQGLLSTAADPTRAILRAALHPKARAMRWVIARGAIDPGRGPATRRSGAAFIAARERLATAATRREPVAAMTGDPRTDELLDGTAPLLGELLEDLSRRQREIARLMLVEGLRQSEVADRLGVSRATVSVAADRAHIRSIGELARVVRTLIADASVGSA